MIYDILRLLILASMVASLILFLGYLINPRRAQKIGRSSIFGIYMGMMILVLLLISVGHRGIYLDARALLGDSAQCYRLAKRYKTTDFPRYLYWIKRSAKRGNPEAMAELAALFSGKSETFDISAQYALKAARAGNPLAQYLMGENCLFGKGVPMDRPMGIEWLSRAARGGNADSTLVLGSIYWHDAQFQDFAKAREWFAYGADRCKDPLASYYLAVTYLSGQLGIKDPAQSLRYYKQAFADSLDRAHAGDTKAEYVLANLYAMGAVVPEDKIEAYRWMLLSADGKFMNANDLLGQFAARLDEREIAEGKLRAKYSKTRS